MLRNSILNPGDLCEVKGYSLLVLHEQKRELMLVLSVLRCDHIDETDVITGFIDGHVVTMHSNTMNVVAAVGSWAYANPIRC